MGRFDRDRDRDQDRERRDRRDNQPRRDRNRGDRDRGDWERNDRDRGDWERGNRDRGDVGRDRDRRDRERGERQVNPRDRHQRERNSNREQPNRRENDKRESETNRRTCPFLVRLFLKIDSVRRDERFEKPPLIRLFSDVDWTAREALQQKTDIVEFKLHTWKDAPLSELLDTVVRACKLLDGKDVRTFNFGIVKPNTEGRHRRNTIMKFLGHAVPTLSDYNHMRVNPSMNKSGASLSELDHKIGEYLVLAIETIEEKEFRRKRKGSSNSY